MSSTGPTMAETISDKKPKEDSSEEITIMDNLQQYDVIKCIGKGNFGKVYLCRDKDRDHLLAVKVQDIHSSKSAEKQVCTEAHVLETTYNPFLVHLRKSFCTCESVCLVTDYLSGGDLFYHLYERDESLRYFNEDRTRFYGAELVCALTYLHEMGIIYRDLKLENILVDHEGHIKITDFGLCKEKMLNGKKTNSFCGSPEHMAPEVIEGIGYDKAVDWWGLGIVMFEMMNGALPFVDDDVQILFEKILEKEVRFFRLLSTEATSLIRSLLQKDPKKRLGSEKSEEQIKQHLFFAKLNWNDVKAKKICPPFIPEKSTTALTTERMMIKNF